ncbi:MAG TPA: OmpA family protein [Terriglobales bacterium]|jgi:outer membrane protein OmpA-like peptidoglycan-associated protein|nr:OmpA family protein [Terriglobales bacterium]
MRFERHISRWVLSTVVLLLVAGSSAFAQNGKVNFRVTPKQAYIYVDNAAIGEASKHSFLSLSAGEHKVELVNYGYQPVTRTVTVVAKKTVVLEVALEAAGGKVSGPFGAITIEGASRDAVLLNGKSPDYFVGHGDEFNNEFLFKQELVVPPGTYQVSIQSKDKDVWSGPVSVAADQRVVVDAHKGIRKAVPWKRGEKFGTIPRFTVGTASARVAVAKPVADLSATTAKVNCGETSQLKWTSSDAPKVEITPVGEVTASGEVAVQPKQTTTYNLTASGPGGTATSSVTVDVNSAIQADLGLSSNEVHYKRVGNQVIEDGKAQLTWTVSNASAVSIDSVGTVDPSGSRSFTVAPQKSDFGPVDETVNYTLKATNECGGAETQTVALHILGSIEPGALTMRSVYFPTDQPGTRKSQAGLLASEQEALKTIAEEFKKYLAYKPDAQLILSGYADRRGPKSYNQRLSERRAELVKRFLVEQGIPDANIATHAFGKDSNLTADQVKQLVSENAGLTDEARQSVVRKFGNIVLAYNRRVDLTLSSTGQESAQVYPFNANDYARMVDRKSTKKAKRTEVAAERERESAGN